MKLLAIRRDAIFSPNSIEKDRIILQQVMDGFGTSVRMIDETLFLQQKMPMYMCQWRGISGRLNC